jgi:hypothetical protein
MRIRLDPPGRVGSVHRPDSADAPAERQALLPALKLLKNAA